jgi:DNA-binding transcriptional MerR regulator
MSEPRAGVKSASAFRTISEVSAELGVPQHDLRFWETKFTQLRPLKRGGGRRYYRPEDITLLKHIQGLLYDEGYTIKGVQRLFRDGRVKAGAKSKAPSPQGVGDSVAGGQVTEAATQSAARAKPAGGALADLRALLDDLTDVRDILQNTSKER